ncbi:hypothetical protein EI94DRAFT_199972 [Lactarius quietus]|nr:hypothetical protein EI94DRAFT_199972 [Lactarius quietus]
MQSDIFSSRTIHPTYSIKDILARLDHDSVEEVPKKDLRVTSTGGNCRTQMVDCQITVTCKTMVGMKNGLTDPGVSVANDRNRPEFTASDFLDNVMGPGIGEVTNKYSPNEWLVLPSVATIFVDRTVSSGVTIRPTELIIDTTPVRIHIFL